MLREEKLVVINGINVANNGFRSLAFETSRIADGISAIRGFGNVLNERNLSVIDIFNLEFIVDAEELKNIALIYSMFKACGALPLENEYIFEKVKSSVSYDRFGDNKKKNNEPTKLLVLLEKLAVTSQEKTNNGYSVSMTLSLYRHGLNEIKSEVFRQNFEKWDEEVGFSKHIKLKVGEQFSALTGGYEFSNTTGNNGGVMIERTSINKVNALTKESVLMEVKNSMLKEEDIDKYENIQSELEFKNRQKITSMQNDSVEIINIKPENIGQVELITHNKISEIPMHGELIGMKSYMGVGQTNFNVKMVFDEEDKEILSKLKELSDKNFISNKFTLTTPIANMFDFHDCVITNVFFSNAEKLNGIIVTMQMQMNGYKFTDKMNRNLTVNNYKVGRSLDGEKATGAYLELLINETTDISNSLEDQATLKNKFEDLARVIIDTEVEGKKVTDGTEDIGKGRGNFFGFMDMLSTYSQTSSQPFYHKYKVGNTQENGDRLDKIEVGIEGEFFALETLYNVKNGQVTFNKTFKNFESFVNTFTNVSDIGNSFFSDWDKHLRKNRDFVFAKDFIKYLDTCALLRTGKKTSENFEMIREGMNKKITKSSPLEKLNEEVIKPILDEFFLYNSSTSELEELMAMRFVFNEYLMNIYDVVSEGEISKLLDNSKFIDKEGIINFHKLRSFSEKVTSEIINTFTVVMKDLNFVDKIANQILMQKRDMNERMENPILSPDKEDHRYVAKVEGFFKKYIDKYDNYLSTHRESLNDSVYNVILSKYAYIMMCDKLSGKDTIGLNGSEFLLKQMTVSAALMSPFFLPTDASTLPYGWVSKKSMNTLGSRMIVAMMMVYEREKFTNESLEDGKLTEVELIKVTLEKTFSTKNLDTSYYINKFTINVDEFNSAETLIDENKKDYNYFYGKKLSNTSSKEIVREAVTKNETSMVFGHKSKEFIEKTISSFSEDIGYNKPIDIHKTGFLKSGRAAPDSMRYDFFEEGGKTTNFLKRRLISDDEPFTAFSKIAKHLETDYEEIMPDYDILVGKVSYDTKSSGIFTSVNLVEHASLSNVNSIRISKDPKTKIKTCTIRLVDLNKNILLSKEDEEDTISVRVNKNDGRVELFSIEAGDDIKINIGHSGKKDRLFNGLINEIRHQGPVVEIDCVGYSSAFYTRPMNSFHLGRSVIDKAKSIVSFISANSDNMNLGDYFDNFSSQVLNRMYSSTTNSSPKPFETNNSVSAFTAFCGVLAEMPSEVKKPFMNTENESVSLGELSNRQTLIDNLSRTFSNLYESEDVRSKGSTKALFENINNVDIDFETYGFGVDKSTLSSTETNGSSSFSIKYKNKNGKESKLYNADDIVEVIKDGKIISVEEYKLDEISLNNKKESVVKESVYYRGKVYNDKLDTIKVDILSEKNSLYSVNQNKYFQYGVKDGGSINIDKPSGGNYSLCWPVQESRNNNEVRRVVSLFGQRIINGEVKKHYGIDIASSNNADRGKVVAAASGTIIAVTIPAANKLHVSGGGCIVVIQHKHINRKTYYMHLAYNDKLRSLKVGDKVSQGQYIADVGDTGARGNYHLHFEVRMTVDGYKEEYRTTGEHYGMKNRHGEYALNPLVEIECFSSNETTITEDVEVEYVKAKDSVNYEAITISETISSEKSNSKKYKSLSSCWTSALMRAPASIEFISKKPGEIFNFYEENLIDMRWDVRQNGDYETIILGRDRYFYSYHNSIVSKVKVASKSSTIKEVVLDKNFDFSSMEKGGILTLPQRVYSVLVNAGFDNMFDMFTAAVYYEERVEKKVKESMGLSELLEKNSIRKFSENHYAISGCNLISYNINQTNDVPNTVTFADNENDFEKLSMSICGSNAKDDAVEILEEMDPKARTGSTITEKITNTLVKEMEYSNQGKIFITFNPDIEINDGVYLMDSLGNAYGKFRIETFEHIFDDRGLVTVLNVKSFASFSEPALNAYNTQIAHEMLDNFSKELTESESENSLMRRLFELFMKNSVMTPKYVTINRINKEYKTVDVDITTQTPTVLPICLHGYYVRGKVKLPTSLEKGFYKSESSIYTNFLSTYFRKKQDEFMKFASSTYEVISKAAVYTVDTIFSMLGFGFHELLKGAAGITYKKAEEAITGNVFGNYSDDSLEAYDKYSPYDSLYKKVGKNTTIAFFNIKCMKNDEYQTLPKTDKVKNLDDYWRYKKAGIKKIISEVFDYTFVVEAYSGFADNNIIKSDYYKEFADSLVSCSEPSVLTTNKYGNEYGIAYGHGYSPKQEGTKPYGSGEGQIFNLVVSEIDNSYVPELPEEMKVKILWLHNYHGGESGIIHRKENAMKVMDIAESYLSEGVEVIVMGDFNLQVLNYGEKPTESSGNSRNENVSLWKESNFVSKIDKKTTYGTDGKLSSNTYDQILVSKNLDKYIKRATRYTVPINNGLSPLYISDHAPVFVEFSDSKTS